MEDILCREAGPVGHCCDPGHPGTPGPPGIPDRKKLNKIRDIFIKQLDVGYVVKIGCQEFAITNQDVLLRQLISYIQNPSQLEKEYHSGKDLFND